MKLETEKICAAVDETLFDCIFQPEKSVNIKARNPVLFKHIHLFLAAQSCAFFH